MHKHPGGVRGGALHLAELSESEADELRVCTSTVILAWVGFFGLARRGCHVVNCVYVFHDAGGKHEGATWWWLYLWCKSQSNNLQRGQLITQVAYKTVGHH